jgi:hypothetical protein
MHSEINLEVSSRLIKTFGESGGRVGLSVCVPGSSDSPLLPT